MKPAPAISVLATKGDFGSSVRIRCASSRGFFFSGRANCIAALLEKSPWAGFFGRSISRLTGMSGATVSRASPISRAIWSLSGWVLDMVTLKMGSGRHLQCSKWVARDYMRHVRGGQTPDDE